MTIASRNQISHYQEAKSNFQSLVKQTCQVGLGFAVMLLVTAGRPSAFGLSVTVGLGIAFVVWGEVRRLDSNNFSINIEGLGVKVIELGTKHFLGRAPITPKAIQIKRIIKTETYNEQAGNFGIGQMSGGEIQDGAKVGGIINESQQKSLAEVAKEIQELLDKLSQTYPTTKTTEKMEVVGKAINFIEDYPSFKSTIIKVLKDVGAESFREAVDHPLANILMAGIEAWTE
jgi:predicted DNA-binding protein